MLVAGPDGVHAVMLGSTHFVNACIQRKGLAKVAVIRLCGPATQALPPFCDMPPQLRGAVAGHYAFVSGGPYNRRPLQLAVSCIPHPTPLGPPHQVARLRRSTQAGPP